MRKDPSAALRTGYRGGDPIEYIYFNGEPIAEHDPTTGDRSDYIYANGKRIPKADTFDDRIKTTPSQS